MRTRIIATVGPGCANLKTLRAMIHEGVNVFRFNFSHGTMADHERLLELVRHAAKQSTKQHVAILQDLAGHRVRTGRLSRGEPIMLERGAHFVLYRALTAGTRRGVSLDYPGSFSAVKPRQHIFIDDGNLDLEVIKSSEDRIQTVVIQGGRLGERKGVNVPDAELAFPLISTKDITDLEFAIKHRIEYVAQSFVRNAADVLAVKRRLELALPHCKVIAKIENREGIHNFASILRAAHGIMVARGDLGISVPIYEIPILQKWMIAACNHYKKPVITATQMLENMLDSRRPSRAEVSDVANAVIDGSDFVMLSGETATGKYPIEAVRMMRMIIEHTEHSAPYRGVRRTR